MSLESLIGFDAREMWSDLEAPWTWTPERRKIFLMNPRTPKPLSADLAVWPSVFDLNATLSLSIPHDVRWRMGLWSTRQQLETVLRSHIDQAKLPYWIIAVTQYRENDDEELLYEMSDEAEAINNDSWQFLGFDVYDGMLLSALLNFGGDVLDIQHRAEKFASKLNEHHLFSKPEDAFAYRQWCYTDQDFVVHGPFYIFGLYTLRQE